VIAGHATGGYASGVPTATHLVGPHAPPRVLLRDDQRAIAGEGRVATRVVVVQWLFTTIFTGGDRNPASAVRTWASAASVLIIDQQRAVRSCRNCNVATVAQLYVEIAAQSPRVDFRSSSDPERDHALCRRLDLSLRQILSGHDRN